MSETPAAPAKPPLKERLNTLFEEYGRIAIAVWLGIAVVNLAIFYSAAQAGLDLSALTDPMVSVSQTVLPSGCAPDELPEQAGPAAVACLGHQASKPFRIMLTLLLVPIVGRMRQDPNTPR